MSLYRQAGGYTARAILAAALAGLVLGAIVGFLAGRGSVEQRSVAEAVADAREQLRPVALGLEQIPIEYEGALRGGRVVAETEYEAATSTADRTQAALDAAATDMRLIDPLGFAQASRAVDRVGAALDSIAPAARVEALSMRASRQIDSLAGDG